MYFSVNAGHISAFKRLELKIEAYREAIPISIIWSLRKS
jgi:hypothetical protein